MTTLATLLDPIVAGLGSLPDVKSCEAFGGRFDMAALARFGAAAPAIRVAVLGVDKINWIDTGQLDGVVEVGAFIVTRDERGKPRDLAVLGHVHNVLVKVHAERWGLPLVQAGRPARCENLYSGAVQSAGLALWGVRWTMKLRMGANAYAQNLSASVEIWSDGAALGTLGGQP
ncbi:Uncharacterised protein [Starkeya nomas]|uniref:Uncharacterized protein n=1 Tax=Starkeya nomas TaxID=2666134 RepID=A0A5S9R4E2_9HYPH|nr:hypothetical protein [Starkeya nomas]CAA0129474.1 Uncharacterised protein [Starkeya nomas]